MQKRTAETYKVVPLLKTGTADSIGMSMLNKAELKS